MGDLAREAEIGAEPERLFDFVSDPANAPRYISSITRIISGPQGTPAVGGRWLAQVQFLGKPEQLNLRITRLQRPHIVEFAMEGDPNALLSIRIARAGGSSKTFVSLGLNVPSVPGFLLGGMLGGLLAGDLERLRRIMESPPE